jgi:hypothetical protein
MRQKAITAKYRGVCCLCNKAWLPGESIKPDEVSTRWGHTRCVNKDTRERAIQRNLDANAVAANERRWNTA